MIEQGALDISVFILCFQLMPNIPDTDLTPTFCTWMRLKTCCTAVREQHCSQLRKTLNTNAHKTNVSEIKYRPLNLYLEIFRKVQNVSVL